MTSAELILPPPPTFQIHWHPIPETWGMCFKYFYRWHVSFVLDWQLACLSKPPRSHLCRQKAVFMPLTLSRRNWQKFLLSRWQTCDLFGCCAHQWPNSAVLKGFILQSWSSWLGPSTFNVQSARLEMFLLLTSANWGPGAISLSLASARLSHIRSQFYLVNLALKFS